MTEQVIRFGTDGWRARIADTFTFDNVKLVSQAIADHLKAKNADNKIVIGYDTRFFSEDFAKAAASVFTANDFRVFLPRRALPTPIVAYAITLLRASGAIMFTASHNPYYYNGIKFISEQAGPAAPDVTSDIERNIELLTSLPEQIADVKKEPLIEEIDPFPAYKEHLERLVDFKALQHSNLKVVVDPLFGAGYGLLQGILKQAGCSVTTIHDSRDVFFGGSMPDPNPEILSDLMRAVLDEKADAGLALDGDGDRFGLIDEEGAYLSPNQLIPVITYHLLKNRQMRGSIVRSIATTHLLDKIAADFEVDLVETPVGFKYISQEMLKGDVLLGGEESGGLSIKGHIPEKDGLLACVLTAEAIAFEKKPLSSILQNIQEKYGFYHSVRLDILLEQEKKEALLQELDNKPPKQIAGEGVISTIRIDGMKLILASGAWILIRPSGTEPLIRVYLEATSTERLHNMREFVEDYLKNN